MHAVEVGRPGVHAGLSGDSSAFDARGRRLAWCPSTYRGVIVVSVPIGSVDTVYQQVGDSVVVLAFSIIAGASIAVIVRAVRTSRRGRSR